MGKEKWKTSGFKSNNVVFVFLDLPLLYSSDQILNLKRVFSSIFVESTTLSFPASNMKTWYLIPPFTLTEHSPKPLLSSLSGLYILNIHIAN